jgi:hypothetical protein
MSQVTLQGNASGTGIFTIAAPNSNTNRTLNLPDAGGAVIVGTQPAGDIVGTTATQTLTNKTLSTGTAITAGTINGATIGATTASTGSFTSLTDSGNLAFTGTGNRITGDFSNATVANRVMFQTSTVNGNTRLGLLPNGTATITSQSFFNAADPSNAGFLAFAAGSEAQITSGITGTGTYLPMTFQTGGSERVRIDTSGNVGIRTSSPVRALSIQSGTSGAETIVIEAISGFGEGTTTTMRLTNSNAFGSSAGAVELKSARNASGTGSSFVVSSSNVSGAVVERMRIDSSGNLLVGATAPDTGSRLLVRGSGTTSAAFAAVIEDSVGQDILALRNDGAFFTGTRAASPYNNTTASGANMVVFSDGRVARSTSSLKYKIAVQDATHGLAQVMALRPVTYKGNNDGELVFGGLIAEEVHEAGLTEFVQYAEDGTPDALAYSNMVSLAFKAIQEQQAIIEQLKARLDAANL